MPDPHDRAEAFRGLHDGPTFVLPNPWGSGSARVLTAWEILDAGAFSSAPSVRTYAQVNALWPEANT